MPDVGHQQEPGSEPKYATVVTIAGIIWIVNAVLTGLIPLRLILSSFAGGLGQALDPGLLGSFFFSLFTWAFMGVGEKSVREELLSIPMSAARLTGWVTRLIDGSNRRKDSSSLGIAKTRRQRRERGLVGGGLGPAKRSANCAFTKGFLETILVYTNPLRWIGFLTIRCPATIQNGQQENHPCNRDLILHALGSGGGQQGSQTGTHTGTCRQTLRVTQYGSMVQVVHGTCRTHSWDTIRHVT